MFDAQKLADSLHYDGTREYTRVSGEVAYLDGKRLGRPADMPRAQRNVMLVIVALGIVVGAFILYSMVITPLRASLTMEETVAQNILRTASLESVPALDDLITLDDAAIRQALEAEGGTFYDATALTDSGNLMIVRVPDDMTVDEAGLMYLRGIGSLSAADATRLLCGSWVLNVDRVNTTSMAVHFADFSTDDPQRAVDAALAHEDFADATVTESGKDDSGNTYTQGTLEIGKEAYVWKVSALPLDDMYSIRDLPEDACYVGVRLTKA